MPGLTPKQVIALLEVYDDIQSHIDNLHNALGRDSAAECIYTMSVAQNMTDLPRPSATSDKTARVAAEYAMRAEGETNDIKDLICTYQNVQAQIDVALGRLPEDEKMEIALRYVKHYKWIDVCLACEKAFPNAYRCEKTRKERVKKNLDRIGQFLYISEADYGIVTGFNI